jgi:hypothetical protein
MNDRPKSSARQHGEAQWAEMTQSAHAKMPLMRIDTERLPEEIGETLSDLLLALNAYRRADKEPRATRDKAILNTIPRLAEMAERAGVYLDLVSWSIRKPVTPRRRRRR